MEFQDGAGQMNGVTHKDDKFYMNFVTFKVTSILKGSNQVPLYFSHRSKTVYSGCPDVLLSRSLRFFGTCFCSPLLRESLRVQAMRNQYICMV